MAKRVHQLAKELGVKSTAIVSKCKAEGIDIKNHMSTLSAGLEATVSEWFTNSEVCNTVETSARVDLNKVKSKKKSKKADIELEVDSENASSNIPAEPTAPAELATLEVEETPEAETDNTVQVSEASDIPKETKPHELNHTFAHRYLQQHPGDLVGLARILGHESLDTTIIYTRLTPGELAQRVEQIPLKGYCA